MKKVYGSWERLVISNRLTELKDNVGKEMKPYRMHIRLFTRDALGPLIIRMKSATESYWLCKP